MPREYNIKTDITVEEIHLLTSMWLTDNQGKHEWIKEIVVKFAQFIVYETTGEKLEFDGFEDYF